jgi:hypothetical protein
LHLVEDSSSTHRATHAICDLVLHTIPAARLFLPAMEWAVCEVIDNIQLHAQSPVPGVVCAQFFPRQNRLDIAICDAGRGIKASLSEAHNLPTHAEAIRLAIQRGVTRSQAVGQGNGLAGSVEIARLNQGEFHLWTGDVDYHTKNGRSGIYAQIPTIPGTGVFFRLDTRHPVDLSHTFIGRSDWTYLDYAAGHISDAGGLRVLDECPHVSGRTAGRAVRLKVLALLPTLEEPLVLDFSGVESATSSFLDELLGRLADELGPEAFRRRIQVANLAPALSDMANVVIHQRVVG